MKGNVYRLESKLTSKKGPLHDSLPKAPSASAHRQPLHTVLPTYIYVHIRTHTHVICIYYTCISAYLRAPVVGWIDRVIDNFIDDVCLKASGQTPRRPSGSSTGASAAIHRHCYHFAYVLEWLRAFSGASACYPSNLTVLFFIQLLCLESTRLTLVLLL